MLSPSVLIGPREDESVLVMRLEKKSSIHNLTKRVCNAMQHGKCSPCPFFPSTALLSGRLMSPMCSCETFSYSALMCWGRRFAKAIERVGKVLKRSTQLHLHKVRHSQPIEFQHLLFCAHQLRFLLVDFYVCMCKLEWKLLYIYERNIYIYMYKGHLLKCLWLKMMPFFRHGHTITIIIYIAPSPQTSLALNR